MLRRVSRSSGAPSRPLPARRWSLLDLAALVAVTGLGGVLRFVRLGDPPVLMFDEVYYARDACWYLYASKSLCRVDAEQSWVHPPLGKHLIAAGMRLFGYDSFGWRVAAAAAGTLMIAVLFVLARKLLGSTAGATIAAGLLAVDLLAFVQSRIAMLEVFAALLSLAAILFAVLDRDAILARAGPRGRRDHPLWRPWRLAAGVAAGAATASKWSGALAAATVLVLVVAWEASSRRARGGPWVARRVREEGPSIALYLVVAPVVVYAASYVGRLQGALLGAPWSQGAWLRALWDRQLAMFSFHSGLDVIHSYQSPAWSWPLLKRPVSYYFDTSPSGDYLQVLAAGSPLVWWSALAALAYVAVRWAPRRDPAGPEGLILGSFCLAYLPWLLLAGDRGAVFLFYLLPAVPFMCLALGYVATRLEHLPATSPAIGLFCAAAVALFAFYYPLLAKRPLPREEWESRVWIFDDCEKRSGAERTSAPRGGSAIASSETDGGENRPPVGWCWI
jgi:dolichyl-phosphate-mannose-protein mannosyltransferase